MIGAARPPLESLSREHGASACGRAHVSVTRLKRRIPRRETLPVVSHGLLVRARLIRLMSPNSYLERRRAVDGAESDFAPGARLGCDVEVATLGSPPRSPPPLGRCHS